GVVVCELRLVLRDAVADLHEEGMARRPFGRQHTDLSALLVAAVSSAAVARATAGSEDDCAGAEPAQLQETPPTDRAEPHGARPLRRRIAMVDGKVLVVRHVVSCSFAIYSMRSFKRVMRSG